MKRLDLVGIANLVASCKTNGLNTVKLLKWVSLHRKLRDIRDETTSFMNDLADTVKPEVEATVDVQNTDAGKKFLEEDMNFETEKFLTMDELISIKEQNELNTYAFTSLIDLLLIDKA